MINRQTPVTFLLEVQIMSERSDELAVFPCDGCGIPILTFWDADSGGLLRGEYVLAGDTIWHPKCLDELYVKYERELIQI